MDHYLLYISSATRLLTTEELHEILDVSRVNNTKVGVSGMLVYIDGNFIQLLEGPEPTLDAAFARIKRDQRHKDIIELARGDLPERCFPDWSMGFVNADPRDLASFPGFRKVDPEVWKDHLLTSDPNFTFDLLVTFYRNNMRSY